MRRTLAALSLSCAAACATPTEPVVEYTGGCWLSVDVLVVTVKAHYASCPAPQYVDTFTMTMPDGHIEHYHVTWDTK